MDTNLVLIALFFCATYALKMFIDARMRYIFFKGNAPIPWPPCCKAKSACAAWARCVGV